MLSMASPFSSFFSISIISFTPSTTSCTCSTSEEPRRSALEMSNTPPTEAVSTPPTEDNQVQMIPQRSPQTWGVCSAWAYPGWRGRSGRSPDAHST
uniref:Uncharacterized protein n=1 Tax=Mastacembelus armatus TaxID=205130 RepID=A0A3Q3N7R8_9TELE